MSNLDLQAHLQERLQTVLGEIPQNLQRAMALQKPKDFKFGDVALPCFPLAKLRGKAPQQIAQEIATAIEPDDIIESATPAGPFVNFRFQRAALARSVIEGILSESAPYGPAASTGKTILIDFSSPNIAKPFHMGHLRSTVIGAALCRIHRMVGNEVHGINHLGDWGSQFGKIITAFLRWGSDEQLEQDAMRHLFEIYVRYAREAKEDKSLDEESAEHFRRLESGEDNEERALWTKLRSLSLEAFQGPYRRLGVEFDHVTGESFYEDKMASALERVRKTGVLVESEGAEVIDLEDQGMPPCLLVKSDGTTLYATRDLTAIFYREETFHFDRALYVVGAEQKLHFRQLIAGLQKMGSQLADRIEHVSFGLILSKNEESGRWEKFATRGGNAIFLAEVLDEAVAQVRRIIEEKNPDIDNADEVAEKIGTSAIIFNDVKNTRIKDVKFDWDLMLSFEGETGPYVQYAGARLAGILRKAGHDSALLTQDSLSGIDYSLLADADRVLLSMLDFGPAVQRAADQNEPSIITNLMIQIAGEIHSYLRDHHVLRAEPDLKEARLVLVAAARKILSLGLSLIGVASLDRM